MSLSAPPSKIIPRRRSPCASSPSAAASKIRGDRAAAFRGPWRGRSSRRWCRRKRSPGCAEVLAAAELVTIAERVAACRDPSDDKFLELAVNGKADVIVSGDRDLRDLNPFRGIRIMTPADFVKGRGTVVSRSALRWLIARGCAAYVGAH